MWREAGEAGSSALVMLTFDPADPPRFCIFSITDGGQQYHDVGVLYRLILIISDIF